MAKTKAQGAPTLTGQLREAIAKSGMSLNGLSQISDVDSGTLSRFMQGKRTLTLPVAEKLVGALGLKVKVEGPEPARRKDPERLTH